MSHDTKALVRSYYAEVLNQVVAAAPAGAS